MTLAPTNLTTNRRLDPLGIDTLQPEFAWHIAGTSTQLAYEIEVATDRSFDSGTIVWASGRVDSPRPFGVEYGGEPLVSRTRYFWHVRTSVLSEAPSPWSDPAWFETGILDPSEWLGRWISAPSHGRKDRRTLYFRSVAELPAPVLKARAYASALGWYRLFVNGVDQTGHSLVPRWTPFHEFIEYQVYDVTDVFTSGINTIGMIVAEGRYRGRLGVMSKGARYGDRLGALLQIELDLADGSHVTLSTDGTWKVGTGRIRRSDPKFGERADLRVDDRQWLTPEGTTLNQSGVEILPNPSGSLIAEEVERVTDVGRIAGTVGRSASGMQLVDFGQNFAGVARVRLPAGRGKLVRLTYSEVLKPDGEIDTGYLEMKETKPDEWFQFDEVKLGDSPTEYTPSFTIHGFRYLAIEGLDSQLEDHDVQGIVLSTELRETAEFHASDPRLEKLWRNVRWSMRSNFTDTASDCPTRERSGWTGDVQIFGPTAAQMANVSSFYRRYLRNAAADQDDDGRLPVVIPAEDSQGRGRNLLRFASASVGWGMSS